MRTRVVNGSPRPPVAGANPVDSPDALAAALLRDSTRRRGARFTGEPIRLAVLDRNALMRHAFRALLARDPRLQLVGDSCDVEACVGSATQSAAHVVLLSAVPDSAVVLQQVAALTAVPLGPRVIVMNGEQDPENVLAAFRAGAFGYLSWSASATELIEAIEMVADGMSYVLPTTAKALAAGLCTPPASTVEPANSRLHVLSARERTVLERIARGFSGPEVADQLGITVKTVDTYRHRIHEKLGVHHRSDYVRIALEHDLLRREPS